VPTATPKAAIGRERAAAGGHHQDAALAAQASSASPTVRL